MRSSQPDDMKIGIRDPLRRFPYEVWVKCVCFAAYGEVVGPFPLLSVSQEWQKSIIETPEAWTSIVIDNGEDTLARVNVLLQLSKNLPIDLHILYPKILWEALRLALRHKSRIRAIVISPSGPKNPPNLPFDELLNLLEDGNEFYPQMEEYIANGYQGHGRYRFLGRCPRLFSVQFRLETTVFPLVKLKHLRGRPAEFPIMLEDTDTTKAFDEAIYLTSPYIDNKRGSDKAQPSFRAISPYLERLSYIVSHDNQIGSFLSTVYPRLHSLTVVVSAVVLQAVISTIHIFSNLKNLDLFLRFPDPVSQTRDLQTFTGPQLHSFTLRSHFRARSHDIENIMNDITHTGILGRARSLTFTLYNKVSLATLRNLLRTAPEIQALTISRPYSNLPTDHLLVSLPKLEVLDVNNLADLWYLEAPNVYSLSVTNTPVQSDHKIKWRGEKIASLSIDPGSFDKLRDSILQDEPECQLFPSLTRIKWTQYSLSHGPQVTLLVSITSVTFTSPTLYDGNTKMTPIDAFCLIILQYPDACPVLETVISREYPCWDLFLQVLRLRSDNSQVRSIDSVGLPGYPVFTILEALIHILNGRADNVRLSGEIEEAIQKRLTIYNTCVQCILAGYTHCRLTDPPNSAVPSVEGHETTSSLSGDLPLPTIFAFHQDTREKPEGPKEDWQWWKTLIEKRLFKTPSRVEKCTRHSDLPTTITRYTLS